MTHLTPSTIVNIGSSDLDSLTLSKLQRTASEGGDILGWRTVFGGT